MYAYIEVYDDRITVTFYAYLDGPVVSEHTYETWLEVFAASWFDDAPSIPIHISPDLFSEAGEANSNWQAENL